MTPPNPIPRLCCICLPYFITVWNITLTTLLAVTVLKTEGGGGGGEGVKRGEGVRNVLVWELVIGGLQGRRRQLALLPSQVSARSSPPGPAVMEWELPRVQITLTVSGPAPCLAIWKSCTVTLATEGERLFKREHLVISFNPLQLEIGTLLLNCSCYGYQRLYRQPFQGLFLSSHSSLPPALWEGSVLLLHTISIFERADKVFFFPQSSVLPDTLQTTHSLSIFYLSTTKALQ